MTAEISDKFWCPRSILAHAALTNGKPLKMMASGERSLSSTSLEGACSVEGETYNNGLNVKKRRRKRFLWNPNVSFRSRRKWRTKKSKVAEDSNISLSTESGEHSYCSAVFEAGSSIETEAESTQTEFNISLLCDNENESNFLNFTDDNESDHSSSSSETGGYYLSSGDSLSLSDDQECAHEMEGRSRWALTCNYLCP